MLLRSTPCMRKARDEGPLSQRERGRHRLQPVAYSGEQGDAFGLRVEHFAGY